MDATLSLHDSRMEAEDLQNLTAELLQSIRQETELTAKRSEERGDAGAKGDAVTIGQIVLVALSSGTMVALFQVLKVYVERRPTLEIELEVPGKKLKIKAEHLSAGQIEQTMQAAKQLIAN